MGRWTCSDVPFRIDDRDAVPTDPPRRIDARDDRGDAPAVVAEPVRVAVARHLVRDLEHRTSFDWRDAVPARSAADRANVFLAETVRGIEQRDGRRLGKVASG